MAIYGGWRAPWSQPTRTTTTTRNTTTTVKVPSAGADSPWYMPGSQQPNPYTGQPTYPAPSTGGGGGGGVTPEPPTGPAPPPAPPVNTESAFQAFKNFLLSMGIPVGADIEAIVRKAVIDGYGPEDIYLVLPDIQSTATWTTRFPGWQARVNAGYNQLQVGEYLALENAYKRVLQAAGLPKDFYDQPSDFGMWIANNVSVQEIQDRVNIAVDMANQIAPEARDLLRKFYGVGTGELASYFLDQSRALPILDRQYKAANIAQWAVRNGLQVMGPSHYENLVDAGITEDQAIQGYATVRAFNNTLGQLGDIYGTYYSQLDAENDVFFGQNDKRRSIVAAEVATWSGRSRGELGGADRGTSY